MTYESMTYGISSSNMTHVGVWKTSGSERRECEQKENQSKRENKHGLCADSGNKSFMAEGQKVISRL